MEAKVADAGCLERGVPVRIEMLIGRIELGLPALGSKTTVGEGNR